jgi:hypothetical protein
VPVLLVAHLERTGRPLALCAPRVPTIRHGSPASGSVCSGSSRRLPELVRTIYNVYKFFRIAQPGLAFLRGMRTSEAATGTQAQQQGGFHCPNHDRFYVVWHSAPDPGLRRKWTAYSLGRCGLSLQAFHAQNSLNCHDSLTVVVRLPHCAGWCIAPTNALTSVTPPSTCPVWSFSAWSHVSAASRSAETDKPATSGAQYHVALV